MLLALALRRRRRVGARLRRMLASGRTARRARLSLWTIVGAGRRVGAAIGSVALLRAVREVYHPWYASPGDSPLMIVLAGGAAAWLLYRLAAHLPAQGCACREGAPSSGRPLLVAWVAFAALTASTAPRAAYLWVLPLLAAPCRSRSGAPGV